MKPFKKKGTKWGEIERVLYVQVRAHHLTCGVMEVSSSVVNLRKVGTRETLNSTVVQLQCFLAAKSIKGFFSNISTLCLKVSLTLKLKLLLPFLYSCLLRDIGKVHA